MSIKLHFTEQDWERITRDWTLWWAGELERPLVMIEGIHTPLEVDLPEAHEYTSNFPMDMPADEVIDRYQAHLEVRRFYGDAWPRWWLNFGPGIVAGFLGARAHPVLNTVWFEPATQVNIEDLHLAYDADNIWWRRTLDLTRTAAERWKGWVTVGYTDLGGNLDILASLRTTQQLLLELCDAPEEVARLSGEITRLWLRYYEELDATVQQTGRGTTPWAPIWSWQTTRWFSQNWAWSRALCCRPIR